jgi:hypothetical protein
LLSQAAMACGESALILPRARDTDTLRRSTPCQVASIAPRDEAVISQVSLDTSATPEDVELSSWTAKSDAATVTSAEAPTARATCPRVLSVPE